MLTAVASGERRVGKGGFFLAVAALFIALWAIPARAQGVRYDNILLNVRGEPIAGASVAVCAVTGSTSTTPCTPLSSIWSDRAETVTLANPTTTSSLGNYGFFASPGSYLVQLYGAGLTTQVYTITLACDPSLTPGAAGACGGNIALPIAVANGGTGTAAPTPVAGANIAITGTWPNQTTAFSGTLPIGSGGTNATTAAAALANLNGAGKPATSDAVQHVSPNGADTNDGLSWGTAKLTPGSAITALPANKGLVLLACGQSYTGPTSIPSGVRLQATCLGNSGVNAQPYTTTLTYSASLTIGPGNGIGIKYLNLNFSGTAALTISSVQQSNFDMSVTCATGSPCVTITAAGGINTDENRFDYLNITTAGATGLILTGAATPASSTTVNTFGTVVINMTRSTLGGITEAFGLTQNCDSNHFGAVHIFLTNINAGNGIVFNDSATPAVETGVDNEVIDLADFTSGMAVTGTAVTFNKSKGNKVTRGFGQTSFSTSVSADSTTFFSMLDLDDLPTLYFGAAGIQSAASGTPANILTLPTGTQLLSNTAVQNVVNKQTVIANGGTAAANGNVGLSAGWGTTASVSGATGFTQHARYTITSSGTGQAANPTIQVTLPQALPAATTICTMTQVGGSQPFAMINETTNSATAPVFTYAGTPVAANTVIVDMVCGP